MRGAFSDCHCSVLCVQALCVFLCGGTRLPTLTLPEGFSCGTSTIVHVYPQPHSQCALCSCPRPLCGSVRVATSFPTKTSRKFLETIVKKRGNIYLEWWAQWKALQGFSLWPAHSLKQLKLPVPRDAGSGWITGAVHTVVTASLHRAGLLECTSICSIQTCLLYGHFHMNWMEVQLLLWSAAIQQHSVLICLSQACCKLGALSWFHKNANSSKSRNL